MSVATTWVSSEGPATKVLCPGDSGGPVLDKDGRVVAVNSGFLPSGVDVYAPVVAKRDSLLAQAKRLETLK